MNELYRLLNPDYVNRDYINNINWQQYEQQQNKEVENAVKAIQDFCKAAKKIDQNHQQKALNACLLAIAKEYNW